jgi:Ca2+-binding RTX toxin-like protein
MLPATVVLAGLVCGAAVFGPSAPVAANGGGLVKMGCWALPELSDVAADPEGHVYVARIGNPVDPLDPGVYVYRGTGTPQVTGGCEARIHVRTIDSRPPHQVALDWTSRRLVTASIDGWVQVFHPETGVLLAEWSTWDEDGTPMTFVDVSDVDVDQNGDVYVVDDDRVIRRFSETGVWEATFGSRIGTVAVIPAVGSTDIVAYGTLSGLNRVDIFDSSGDLIGSFGNETLKRPWGITVDDSSIYVVDRRQSDNRARINSFDRDGTYRMTIVAGGVPISTDGAGNVYTIPNIPGQMILRLGDLDVAPLCNGQQATFLGTPGRDIITLRGSGEDVVVALGGNDRVKAALDDDLICLGDGNDIAYGEAGNDTLIGGPGNDTLSGGEGIDWVSGGDGDDTIRLGARNDTAYGDGGNDVINGGGGADYIDGGPGNDTIWDSFGTDTDLYGGTGDDKFVAGRNDPNHYDGGDGSDRIDYRAMPGGIIIDLSAGTTGRVFQDTFTSIEEARGSSHDDLITGDNGINVLIGNAGNDTIHGLGGDDNLIGDKGDDTLYGGDGWDRLVGGNWGETTGDYCLEGENIHPSCEHTIL